MPLTVLVSIPECLLFDCATSGSIPATPFPASAAPHLSRGQISLEGGKNLPDGRTDVFRCRMKKSSRCWGPRSAPPLLPFSVPPSPLPHIASLKTPSFLTLVTNRLSLAYDALTCPMSTTVGIIIVVLQACYRLLLFSVCDVMCVLPG